MIQAATEILEWLYTTAVDEIGKQMNKTIQSVPVLGTIKNLVWDGNVRVVEYIHCTYLLFISMSRLYGIMCPKQRMACALYRVAILFGEL